MRLKNVLLFFLTGTLIFFGIGFYQTAFTKEDGSPSGKTGSPGDGETCAQVDCHTGTAKLRDGLIFTDVPETGYLSTDTFTITVTIDFPGRSTFGFQASAQNLEGDKLGKIIITDDFQTKTTGIGKYITHEKEGNSGSDGKTWTFEWTPDDDTGDVTFYVAVNAADGDEEPTGDSIYLNSITIHEDPENVSVVEADMFLTENFFIQNPVKDNINISSKNPAQEYTVQIFDVQGHLIHHTKNTITGNYIVPVRYLSKGIYFVKIFDGRQFYASRIVKN
ncbi:MAG: T9SS type A sorting domain-containing protein [Chitinophagales bacterium]|nr:T9SS type A sorting domain-containing protein [Chitinophagales bacterium]